MARVFTQTTPQFGAHCLHQAVVHCPEVGDCVYRRMTSAAGSWVIGPGILKGLSVWNERKLFGLILALTLALCSTRSIQIRHSLQICLSPPAPHKTDDKSEILAPNDEPKMQSHKQSRCRSPRCCRCPERDAYTVAVAGAAHRPRAECSDRRNARSAPIVRSHCATTAAMCSSSLETQTMSATCAKPET